MIRQILATMLATLFSTSACAQGDMANMQTLSLLGQMIEADLQVQSTGATGLIKLPHGISRQQFIKNANEWLNGEDSTLIPMEMKARLFRVYWIADQIPRSSACFQDVKSESCEQDFQRAAAQAQISNQDFRRDYENATNALGLPPIPAKWAAASVSPTLKEPLSMPHARALENADRQCDDLAFSSGRQSFGEACKRANHRGVADLLAMRSDPEIRPEFWAACADAVGFQVSANYLGWSQCVRFVRASCPASKAKTDDDYRRCMRAIQGDGWLLNRAAH